MPVRSPVNPVEVTEVSPVMVVSRFSVSVWLAAELVRFVPPAIVNV